MRVKYTSIIQSEPVAAQNTPHLDESPEHAAFPDGIATVDCPILPPEILLAEYKNPKSLVDKRLSVDDAIDTIPNFITTNGRQ